MPRSDSGNPIGDPVPTRAPHLAGADGTALYVHLPFCVAKCSYCDFFSLGVGDTPDRAELAQTIDLILLEARRRAPRAPATVFFGGGTPSLHSADDLTRLFDGLDELTGFRSTAAEVTVECNPESLDQAKAHLLAELGATRLSIGVQSLRPEILALFGRVHAVEDSFRAFDAARAANVEQVSVDLIYAVPGQELATWESDLERVLALGPDHVSAYSLAFEDGTALTAALRSGKVERLDEDTELAFFLRTRELLVDRGFEPYEISNFCSNGHRCRHNELYWRNGDYVGLGPGAVSYLAPTRFGNPRSLAGWRSRVAEDADGHGFLGFGATWEETLEPAARLGETWWLGLRTSDGVRADEARRTAHYPDVDGDPAERLATELEAQGLLRLENGAWVLTDRGLPLADRVSALFLERCANRRAPVPEQPGG